MNEMLIKELIKCKLNSAAAIVDHMPLEISGEIRNVGKIILESLNESVREVKEKTSSETKTSGKLNNIPVE